jgi:hypothetical protein
MDQDSKQRAAEIVRQESGDRVSQSFPSFGLAPPVIMAFTYEGTKQERDL